MKNHSVFPGFNVILSGRSYLQEVATFSKHYAKLLRPTEETSSRIRERLARLYRYEATTTYPFLLDVYHEYECKQLPVTDFVAVLDILESFLIRRFICGVVTSGLTKGV